MIGKYSGGGGKALIEVDPETDPKLEDILQAWNVNMGSNMAVDASGVGRCSARTRRPLVVDYGDSPITKNLQRRHDTSSRWPHRFHRGQK